MTAGKDEEILNEYQVSNTQSSYIEFKLTPKPLEKGIHTLSQALQCIRESKAVDL